MPPRAVGHPREEAALAVVKIDLVLGLADVQEVGIRLEDDRLAAVAGDGVAVVAGLVGELRRPAFPLSAHGNGQPRRALRRSTR